MDLFPFSLNKLQHVFTSFSLGPCLQWLFKFLFGELVCIIAVLIHPFVVFSTLVFPWLSFGCFYYKASHPCLSLRLRPWCEWISFIVFE